MELFNELRKQLRKHGSSTKREQECAQLWAILGRSYVVLTSFSGDDPVMIVPFT